MFRTGIGPINLTISKIVRKDHKKFGSVLYGTSHFNVNLHGLPLKKGDTVQCVLESDSGIERMHLSIGFRMSYRFSIGQIIMVSVADNFHESQQFMTEKCIPVRDEYGFIHILESDSLINVGTNLLVKIIGFNINGTILKQINVHSFSNTLLCRNQLNHCLYGDDTNISIPRSSRILEHVENEIQDDFFVTDCVLSSSNQQLLKLSTGYDSLYWYSVVKKLTEEEKSIIKNCIISCSINVEGKISIHHLSKYIYYSTLDLGSSNFSISLNDIESKLNSFIQKVFCFERAFSYSIISQSGTLIKNCSYYKQDNHSPTITKTFVPQNNTDIAHTHHIVNSDELCTQTKSKNNNISRDIDYVAAETNNISIGDMGEKWIIQYERNTLINSNRPDLAEKVLWASKEIGDGLGYDILSFFPNGDVHYIEVKTTKGQKNQPFYITDSELQFSIKHSDCFSLYRLYNYSEENGNFNLLEIKGSLLPLCNVASQYYVKLKY